MTALQSNFRSQPHRRVAAPPTTTTAGPVWALIFAFATLGFGPAFFWAAKWRKFVVLDRRFWIEVIAAIRPTATTHADASHLDDLARRIGTVRLAPTFCRVMTIAVAVLTFGGFIDQQHAANFWGDLLYVDSSRYGIQRDNIELTRWIWHWSLFAIFIVQWYAVRSYALNIHELVKWTNARAKKLGLPVTRSPALKAGLFPWWYIVMAALVINHAWWGIPMVMAGGLARRYTRYSSEALRAAVTLQLDSKQAFPTVVGPGVRYCAGPGCGRRLPDVARFCPRCGTSNQLPPGVLTRGSAA